MTPPIQLVAVSVLGGGILSELALLLGLRVERMELLRGMSSRRWRQAVLVLLGVWLVTLLQARRVQGIRFVIDRKECWQHEVPYDGDQVRVSYVVIKSESAWSLDHTAVGLDLIVLPPPAPLSL